MSLREAQIYQVDFSKMPCVCVVMLIWRLEVEEFSLGVYYCRALSSLTSDFQTLFFLIIKTVNLFSKILFWQMYRSKFRKGAGKFSILHSKPRQLRKQFPKPRASESPLAPSSLNSMSILLLIANESPTATTAFYLGNSLTKECKYNLVPKMGKTYLR